MIPKVMTLVLVWLASGGAQAAAAVAEVRVSIMSIFKPQELSASGRLAVIVLAEDGKKSTRLTKTLRVVCGQKAPVEVWIGKDPTSGGSVEIRPSTEEHEIEIEVPGSPRRAYAGWFEVRERRGKCLIVNHLPLALYSQDVACKEIRGAGPEALKAQSIASRSYALSMRDKHAADGFDFCDLTHCQAYVGSGACTSAQRRALKAVSGFVLFHEDQPVASYYFSTCGGHTAAAGEVWGPGSARSYLKGGPDGDGAFCKSSPHMRWKLELERDDFCRRIRKKLPKIGAGRCELEIVREGKGGWVSQVEIRAERSVSMLGERFHLLMGRIYGWGKFKSARFVLTSRKNRLVFRGRGMGHGVGLCQYGAMGMEKTGADYRAILQHYFPGTELRPWP